MDKQRKSQIEKAAEYGLRASMIISHAECLGNEAAQPVAKAMVEHLEDLVRMYQVQVQHRQVDPCLECFLDGLLGQAPQELAVVVVELG